MKNMELSMQISALMKKALISRLNNFDIEDDLQGVRA